MLPERGDFDWASLVDRLMATGDRLAEKLRDIDGSPWTEQILEEWAEAKDVRDFIP